MTRDAEALTFAAELARDDVLWDPTDAQIISAVEEFLYGTEGSRPLHPRLQRGVIAVYDDTCLDDSDEEIKYRVRRAQNIFGLC